MAMSEHTEGKLMLDRTSLCDKRGILVAWTETSSRSDEENEANARRLVACWNACGNIPTKWLESVSEELSVRSFAQTIQERDELLAVLRKKPNHFIGEWEDGVQAILAKYSEA
jgi:hypothetical protein